MTAANRIKVRPAALWIAAFGSLACAAPSQAAWEYVPQVGVLVDNNDNPRLTPTDENEASRAIVDARLTMQNVGERSNLFFEPRIRANSYPDENDKDLENDDAFLRSYGQRVGTNITSGFYAEYLRRSIQSSEFLSASPEDPNVPGAPILGTGDLVFLDQRQNSTWLAPYLDYRLSDRSSLRFELQSSDVSYTGPQIRERGAFTDRRFYTGIVRRVDSRTEVSARMFAGTFEGDVNSNETNSAGVEGRFTRPINEVWAFSFGAGVQRSDFRFIDDNGAVIDNATSNVITDVEFRQRAELRTLNVRFAREVYPSGSGFLQEVSQVSVYVDQEFSPRLTGRFGLRYDDITTLDEIMTIDRRDYGRIEAEFRWAMKQRLFLIAGYQLTAQSFEAPNSDAESNLVFVGIQYRGLSRNETR